MNISIYEVILLAANALINNSQEKKNSMLPLFPSPTATSQTNPADPIR